MWEWKLCKNNLSTYLPSFDLGLVCYTLRFYVFSVLYSVDNCCCLILLSFFRMAIQSAREDGGNKEWFQFGEWNINFWYLFLITIFKYADRYFRWSCYCGEHQNCLQCCNKQIHILNNICTDKSNEITLRDGVHLISLLLCYNINNVSTVLTLHILLHMLVNTLSAYPLSLLESFTYNYLNISVPPS